MGITYISVISPHKAYSRSYLFGLTFRYSIVYILVTSMLSLLASMALYRPVRHLKHTIHINELMPDENAGSTRNDFELIETVFQNLIEKYTALKQVRHTFEHQKEQKLLRLLLEQPSAAIQPNSEDFWRSTIPLNMKITWSSSSMWTCRQSRTQKMISP